jgi:hypothetical protein
MTTIDPCQISVVVQGPVAGKPTDPPEARLTSRCLESLRRHLPGAQLILSTWAGSERDGLDCDVWVESADPGAVSYWADRTIPYNVNRQIVSTNAGLRHADRPFALKIRSDLEVTGNGFLQLWARFPVRRPEWRVLKERIVASAWPTCNFRRCPLPFALSDWFHFGLRQDVTRLWDLPLAADSDMARYFETRPRPVPDKVPQLLSRYNAEQYVWLGCLRKHGEVPCEHIWDVGAHNRQLAELALVNNVVLAEPDRLGLRFCKYDFRTTGIFNYYTFLEWQGLYQQYCDRNHRLGVAGHLAGWRDKAVLWAQLAFDRGWARMMPLRRANNARGERGTRCPHAPPGDRAHRTLPSPGRGMVCGSDVGKPNEGAADPAKVAEQ